MIPERALIVLVLSALFAGCVEPTPVEAPTESDPCPDHELAPGVAGEVVTGLLEPLARAAVTIRLFDDHGMTTAFLTVDTDPNGRFWFCGLNHEQDYSLEARKEGFQASQGRYWKDARSVDHRIVLHPE